MDMRIEAKSIAYDTSAVSKRQFDEHLKLYKGYVDKTNQIRREIKKDPERGQANGTYSKYRGLKKGETYAINGVILHEEYFRNMTGEPCRPEPRTMRLFEECFGGYEAWEQDFTACCLAARGWCVLAHEQRTRSFCHILQDLHDDGVITMAYPLLVMDMYEHAYFLDYGTDKSSYIKGFIKSIDWHVVEKRLEKIE